MDVLATLAAFVVSIACTVLIHILAQVARCSSFALSVGWCVSRLSVSLETDALFLCERKTAEGLSPHPW